MPVFRSEALRRTVSDDFRVTLLTDARLITVLPPK